MKGVKLFLLFFVLLQISNEENKISSKVNQTENDIINHDTSQNDQNQHNPLIKAKRKLKKKIKKKRKLFIKKLFNDAVNLAKSVVKNVLTVRKDIYVPKKKWAVNQLNDKGDYKYEFTSMSNFNTPDSIGNIEFNPTIHKTSQNYFQLTYPFQSITGGSLPEVKNFLYKWFKVDKYVDKLDIKNFVQDGIKVRNRYVVTYFSKIDYIFKKYYIDINFRNNKGNPDQFGDITKVQMFGSSEDASYNTDFEHTLKQDCKTIKAFLANPQQIECHEVVDKDKYIIRGVYDVDAKFIEGSTVKKFEKRIQVQFKLDREPIKPTIPPARTQKDILKGDFLIDLVEKKLKMSEHIFKWWEKPAVLAYYLAFVKPVLKKNQDKIREFYRLIKQRLMYVERDYQKALRNELTSANVGPILDKTNFSKTVDRMESKVDEINAYYIQKAIQKQTYSAKVKHDMDVYYGSLKKFQFEQKEIEQMFDEEQANYKRDKELDNEFRNWTSTNGNF